LLNPHEDAEDTQRPRSHRAWLLVVIAPAVLSVLLYLPSLRNAFTYDDKMIVNDAPGVRRWANVPTLLTRNYYTAFGEKTYRPVVSLSYLLEYQAAGLHAHWVYHLTNVLLHGIAVAGVGLLALRLIGRASGAFVAAMVFAVHPIQGEVVNAVAFREDALCAIFLVGMLLAYLGARRSPRRAALPATLLYVLAMVLCAVLAMLSKEIAAVAALLLAAYEWLCGRVAGEGGSAGRRTALIAAVALACVVVAAWSFLVVPNVQAKAGPPTGPPDGEAASELPDGGAGAIKVLARQYRLTVAMPAAMLRYFRTVVLPVGLSPVYEREPVASPLSGWFIVGVLFVLGWLGCIVLLRRWGGIAFGMAWTALLLLPVSNVLPFAVRTAVQADRFLYVPMIGVGLAAGAAASGLLGGWARSRLVRAGGWVGFALTLCLWCVLVQARIPVWHDDFTLFSDAVQVAPKAPKIHVDLARYYDPGDAAGGKEGKNVEKAIWELRKSIQLEETPEAGVNLGKILVEQFGTEQIPKARALFERALRRDPMFVQAISNLGLLDHMEGNEMMARSREFRAGGDEEGAAAFAEEATGFYRSAFQRWDEALRVNPSFGDALYNKGLLQLKLGDIANAKSTFQHLLRLAPRHVRALLSMGDIMINAGGAENRGAARSFFEKALAIDPRVVRAYSRVGLLDRREGNELMAQARQLRVEGDEAGARAYEHEARAWYEAALAEWRRALAIDPDSAQVRLQVGNLRFAQGDFAGARAEYERILSRLPRHGVAHLRLGQVLIEESRANQACPHLDAAIQARLKGRIGRVAEELYEQYCRQAR